MHALGELEIGGRAQEDPPVLLEPIVALGEIGCMPVGEEVE